MRSLCNFWQASLLALFFALHLGVHGCGAGKNDDTNDKGGDHVPNGRTYPTTGLPLGSETNGLAAIAYKSQALADALHLSETYRLCLDPLEFDDAALKSFAAELAKKGANLDDSGLQTVANETLSRLNEFDSTRQRFSSRITLDVVRSNAIRCDLVFSRVGPTSFPFSESDFTNQDRALLQAGQLVTAEHHMNAVPVAYLKSISPDNDLITMQYLTAMYLGLTKTARGSSYLNPATTSSSPSRAWFLLDDSGHLITSKESETFLAFALAYADVLKPADFERFQYYEDRLNPEDPPSDPLLTIPAGAANLPFTETVGDPYIYGVRKTAGEVSLCFDDLAQAGVTADLFAKYMTFADDQTAGRIAAQLHAVEPKFSLKPVFTGTACALLISFRNETQFPFATQKDGGLFSAEGSVKNASGVASSIPVIYINTDALSLDPDPAAAGAAGGSVKKPVVYVLEHEFAHFLGFKHSSAKNSVLSPAGYSGDWPEADKALFEEWGKAWGK